jgi:hypothetical protein
MAVPNYTYLKLKIPGPRGVITVASSFQRTYQCKMDNCELASVVLASEELALIRTETPQEPPDSNRTVRSFEPTEGVKEIPLDPKGRAKRS